MTLYFNFVKNLRQTDICFQIIIRNLILNIDNAVCSKNVFNEIIPISTHNDIVLFSDIIIDKFGIKYVRHKDFDTFNKKLEAFYNSLNYMTRNGQKANGVKLEPLEKLNDDKTHLKGYNLIKIQINIPGRLSPFTLMSIYIIKTSRTHKKTT